MRRLRQLIHEIHRRSLWQVLGIYLVASWGVIGAVGTLGDALGLPEWFPRLALGLLIVGLPIVLATAFVQEASPAPDATEQPAAQRLAGAATGLFTWRKAIGGGVLAFTMLGLLGVGWLSFAGRSGPEGAPDSVERSVAVLPFVNMSGDPDNEYFSDGITEELLNTLAQLPELRVPARTTSFGFKGRNLPVRLIADTLGVTHILEGSVRRFQNRVLVTAQLVDARADRHLWSDVYERDLDDVFALQREIARAITDALQIELGEGSPLLTEQTPTTSQVAHDLYLRGRFSLNQRGEHVAEAIRYFEEAIAADPNYARAHGGLALARVLAGAYGVGAPGMVDRALDAAARAIELDSTLSEPHTARGYLPTRIGGVPAAERELRLAIRLDPNDANAHHFLGWALSARGMWDEAIASLTRAILLDPSNPAHHWRRGNMYQLVGRWAEAEADARQALRVSPDDRYARQVLGFALIMSGQVEALREIAVPGDELVEVWIAALTNPDEVDDAIAWSAATNSLGAAWMAAWLDRPELALELIQRLYSDATASSTGFNGHALVRSAALTSLRNHPAFQLILDRLRHEAD